MIIFRCYLLYYYMTVVLYYYSLTILYFFIIVSLCYCRGHCACLPVDIIPAFPVPLRPWKSTRTVRSLLRTRASETSGRYFTKRRISKHGRYIVHVWHVRPIHRKSWFCPGRFACNCEDGGRRAVALFSVPGTTSTSEDNSWLCPVSVCVCVCDYVSWSLCVCP